MKLRRTLIAAVIAVAAATLAATVSASPIVGGPAMGKIAYFNFDVRDSGFDVMLADTNGTRVANITHDGTAKKNLDPNWSTNGMKVAFTSYYGKSGGADIIVVDANGKGRVNLTSSPVAREGIQNINPTFSPDGSVVFASNRDGNFDLYRVGGILAKDGFERITKTEAPTQNLDPDYSPSGKMLVFSRVSLSASRVPTASLFTMRSIAGATATMLTKPFPGLGDRGAAWSPNGRQIAFHSDRAGNNNLYTVNSDGTGLRQLTLNKAADRELSWSPDGTTLVFLSDRTGHTELWMTSLVGMSPGETFAWEVTYDKQDKGNPDWQPTG